MLLPLRQRLMIGIRLVWMDRFLIDRDEKGERAREGKGVCAYLK